MSALLQQQARQDGGRFGQLPVVLGRQGGLLDEVPAFREDSLLLGDQSRRGWSSPRATAYDARASWLVGQ